MSKWYSTLKSMQMIRSIAPLAAGMAALLLASNISVGLPARGVTCSDWWDFVQVLKLSSQISKHHNSSSEIPDHDTAQVKWTIDPDTIEDRKYPHDNQKMGNQWMNEGDNPTEHPDCNEK